MTTRSDVESLVQVTTDTACFALLIVGDTVVDAAPIARWTVGKHVTVVKSYYVRRGADVRQWCTSHT